MTLTVEKLIEELRKVEDKTKTVTIEVDGEGTRYFEITENDYFVTITG